MLSSSLFSHMCYTQVFNSGKVELSEKIVKAFYEYRDRQPSKELRERGWYFFQKSFTRFSRLSQKSCAK